MPIDPISTATLALTPSGQSPAPVTSDSNGFGSSLKDLISTIDSSASQANDAVGKMIDGTGDVHEAMIALQKSDLMLQLTVQVRNKLVQAYQDVMRMPI